MLKRNGITASYASISRHAHHMRIKEKGDELDDFVESMQKFRPVAITINVDDEIRKALERKKRTLLRKLKTSRCRRRPTASSVANYFLEKGAAAILASKETADRVLSSFMKRRASFGNRRKKRLQGRPVTIMISKGLHRKLRIDVPGAVWFGWPDERPFVELCKRWSDAVGVGGEKVWARLPAYPSLTDFVNLALRAGLDAADVEACSSNRAKRNEGPTL